MAKPIRAFVKPPAAILIVALATGSSAADVHTYSGETRVQLRSYCANVRSNLGSDIVDPTNLAEGSTYAQPMPTKILGQQIKAASRRFGLEGTVKLGLVVSAEGKALAVGVIESSGRPRVDKEAVAILSVADFSPARFNGRNSAACSIVRVTFTMKA